MKSLSLYTQAEVLKLCCPFSDHSLFVPSQKGCAHVSMPTTLGSREQKGTSCWPLCFEHVARIISIRHSRKHVCTTTWADNRPENRYLDEGAKEKKRHRKSCWPTHTLSSDRGLVAPHVQQLFRLYESNYWVAISNNLAQESRWFSASMRQ